MKINERIVEIDEICVPDYMYYAWENNDYTGLTDDEIEEMETFFKRYPNCSFEEDEERAGFRSRNDVNNVGGNCVILRVFGEYSMSMKEAKTILNKKGYKLFEKINLTNDSGKIVSKQTLKRKIYKCLEDINGKYYKNGVDKWDWYAITEISNRLKEELPECDVDIWVENGGYRTSKDGYSQWKEYELQITYNDNYYIQGKIICAAAGSVEDPFDKYDVNISLF